MYLGALNPRVSYSFLLWWRGVSFKREPFLLPCGFSLDHKEMLMLNLWFRGISLVLLRRCWSSWRSQMIIGWCLSRVLSIPCKSPRDKCLLNWLGVKSTFVELWPQIYDLHCDQMCGLWWWCRDECKSARKTGICGCWFSLDKSL